MSIVLNRTALIENILNQVIEHYVRPRKGAWIFFWEVLLDTSVMSLGAKIKVVSAIAQELDAPIKRDAIHKVVAYRNAFAHHVTDAHPVFVVGKEQGQDNPYYNLNILNSSGKLERKVRTVALEDFNAKYAIAKESLIELVDRVKNLRDDDTKAT